jgi:hopene-associated glycosyltransferase HpnB
VSAYAAIAAALLWSGLLLAPWRPFSSRERLESDGGLVEEKTDFSDVVALIPARNEAERIADTLKALSSQGENLKIVVVDDQSTDDTVAVVEDLGLARVVLVKGKPLPAGWSGKVWAQAQAQAALDRPLTLLLDADIRLAPGLLATLRHKLEGESAGLVSLVAELPMNSLWERLLMPAFVYFFKLLYPFRLVNDPRSRMAAAAGGCILLKTRIIRQIGGFQSLKDALIDDCTLARLVKRRDERIWLGLTRSARSTRGYAGLGAIWNMVARTAFTQLGYSNLLLILCAFLMVLAYMVPVAGLGNGNTTTMSFSGVALLIMAASYVPTIRFYGLHPAWSLTLPAAAALFLAMTLTSAVRYWNGERSAWRGRVYRRQSAAGT